MHIGVGNVESWSADDFKQLWQQTLKTEYFVVGPSTFALAGPRFKKPQKDIHDRDVSLPVRNCFNVRKNQMYVCSKGKERFPYLSVRAIQARQDGL